MANPIDKFTHYGLLGFLKLSYDVIRTKLFYSNSRIIRSPFYIRGKRNINLGRGLTTGVGCRIDAFSLEKKIVINIGANVQINDYVHIAGIQDITIEDHVLIASRVFISDHNHGDFSGRADPSVILPPILRPLSSKPVKIEESVWIGEGVCILPGTTIGRNSIIGAGAVVTKDIPPWSLAVGNPAVVIKKYDIKKSTWIKV